MAKKKNRVQVTDKEVIIDTVVQEDSTEEKMIEEIREELKDNNIDPDSLIPSMVSSSEEKDIGLTTVEVAFVKEPIEKEELVEVEEEVEFKKDIKPVEEVKDYIIDLRSRLEEYKESMKPGAPLTSVAGNVHQRKLYNIIINVVEKSTYLEFRDKWTELIKFFKENKDTVCNDRYIFRFSESWVDGEESLNTLHRMIHILKLSSESNELKDVVKTISLERALVGVLSTQARERVISFYS